MFHTRSFPPFTRLTFADLSTQTIRQPPRPHRRKAEPHPAPLRLGPRLRGQLCAHRQRAGLAEAGWVGAGGRLQAAPQHPGGLVWGERDGGGLLLGGWSVRFSYSVLFFYILVTLFTLHCCGQRGLVLAPAADMRDGSCAIAPCCMCRVEDVGDHRRCVWASCPLFGVRWLPSVLARARGPVSTARRGVFKDANSGVQGWTGLMLSVHYTHR
jgi:hypothetical protein